MVGVTIRVLIGNLFTMFLMFEMAVTFGKEVLDDDPNRLCMLTPAMVLRVKENPQ